MRYARPAVLPSTGASELRSRPFPHHSASRFGRPPLRAPRVVLPLRAPLPSTLLAGTIQPIYSTLSPLIRCHDPHLETLGNEQPPSKTGSVTRATIILQTWLVDAYPINCRGSLSLSLSRLWFRRPAFSFLQPCLLAIFGPLLGCSAPIRFESNAGNDHGNDS